MGDVTDLSNFMGAVIDRKSFAKLSGVLDRAQGRRRADRRRRRHAPTTARASSSGPTIIEGTDPAHEVFTTEYFGPVLAVHVYDDADYDAVLTQMESVAPYALTGSVIAQDRGGDRARAAVPALRGRQLLRQRQADRRRRRPAALRRRPGLGHQRQGRRPAEPACAGPAPGRSRRPSSPRPTTATRTWAEPAVSCRYSGLAQRRADGAELRRRQRGPADGAVGPTTAPSDGRCGVSRPSGIRWVDRHAPAEDGDVGDQPPVAAPPHALAAHHRDGRRRRLGEHLVEGGGELRRAGVGGVGGELARRSTSRPRPARRAGGCGGRPAARPSGSRCRRRAATPRAPPGGRRGCSGCPGTGGRRRSGPTPGRGQAGAEGRRGPAGRDPRVSSAMLLPTRPRRRPRARRSCSGGELGDGGRARRRCGGRAGMQALVGVTVLGLRQLLPDARLAAGLRGGRGCGREHRRGRDRGLPRRDDRRAAQRSRRSPPVRRRARAGGRAARHGAAVAVLRARRQRRLDQRAVGGARAPGSPS